LIFICQAFFGIFFVFYYKAVSNIYSAITKSRFFITVWKRRGYNSDIRLTGGFSANIIKAGKTKTSSAIKKKFKTNGGN